MNMFIKFDQKHFRILRAPLPLLYPPPKLLKWRRDKRARKWKVNQIIVHIYIFIIHILKVT